MDMDRISAVVSRHDRELMAIDGVAAVYVGAREDSSLCIRVLVLKDKLDAARPHIPETIEGWPVEIEPTDPIRPLKD